MDLELIVGQVLVLTLQPTILEGIEGAQELDHVLHRIWEDMKEGSNTKFSLTSDRVLNFKGRLCFPNDKELRS